VDGRGVKRPGRLGPETVSKPSQPNELTLHEEELELGTDVREAGSVRARKRVEREEVSQLVPREFEHAEFDRVPAGEGDSGEIETLPDGSISIPLLEEELVVTKRIVVRERIVIRKEKQIEQRQVRAELRRERLEIDAPEESSNQGGT
jgi:uncharacterized protein (TIGR02271 family)